MSGFFWPGTVFLTLEHCTSYGRHMRGRPGRNVARPWTRRPVWGSLNTLAALSALLGTDSAVAGAASSGHVLLVGIWHGRPGAFRSIQSAVDAASPGDTILVAPGDYHESPGRTDGVRITVPDILIRGLSRSGVVVDGTRPGAPKPCDADSSWQNVGPKDAGRDGLVVAKVSGVRIENLTVCNFVGGNHGRQISFDGGFGTGRIGIGAYGVDHVTTTSTFIDGDPTELAKYGIFISDAKGPGRVTDSSASNMANSAFHIGACADCRSTFQHDVAVHSAIGITAINAGGRLTISHSVVKDNAAGIDLASEQDESAPPPQDGACPQGVTGPIPTEPHRCTVVMDNQVSANNDQGVPGASEVEHFVGAGIYVAGGRNDAILGNTVTDQGSYGIIVTIYPWTRSPAEPADRCQGGVDLIRGRLCLFNAYGNDVVGNTLGDNGTFGNPTNGDLADGTIAHSPGNCFRANTSTSGALTATPAGLQPQSDGCSSAGGNAIFGPLGVEVACATGALGPCADGTASSVLGAVTALAKALHGDPSALEAPGLGEMKADYPTAVMASAVVAPPDTGLADPCVHLASNAWC